MALRDAAAVRSALESSAGQDLDMVVNQLISVGRIAWRKYELIRYGLVALAVSVVLCVGAALLNDVLS